MFLGHTCAANRPGTDPVRLKEGQNVCVRAGALPTHSLLDEGVFVLHLPLLHGRVDDQLVQLHGAKRQVAELMRRGD